MTEEAREFLTELVWNEIGEELRKELEIQGSELCFTADWTGYSFTKTTADQERRIEQKRNEAKAIMKRHLN